MNNREVDIIQALKEEACIISLTAETKRECLLEIAGRISTAAANLPLDDIMAAFEARESQGSTGFGDGVAIPHARLKNADDFVIAIAVSKRGIDYDSIDKRKAHIFFALAGPEQDPKNYLKLLAQISRVAKNEKARRELRYAVSPLALKETFFRYSPEIAVATRKEQERSKLVTIVLYDQQYLDDITELFIERGIRGVSIQESTGISGVLSRVPLFADLLNFLDERHEHSKTITVVVREGEVASLVAGIEEIMGDLDSHSGAAVYTVDISFMKGSLEAL